MKQLEEPHLHKVYTGKVKQVGNPDSEDPMERDWETAMFKTKREDKVWLSKTGISGDEVANELLYGGLDKALFCYPIKHYADWQDKYERDDMVIGTMGENFAVLEMDEFSVCIGDIYEVGDAIIQVSQPRKPTWQEARRFHILDLALDMQRTGRTGWYYRVLEEGNIWGDIPVNLLERPYPQWSVQAANEIMYQYKQELRLADDLAACGALSQNWVRHLRKRLLGQEPRMEKRIYGPNKG